MKIEIDGEFYNLIIDKKVNNKNTYIRVRENMDIYVTTNYFTSNKYILELIDKNLDNIKKMISKSKKRNDKKDEFFFLGKKYDLIYLNNGDFQLGNEKVFVKPNFDIEKWYKKQAEIIFKEELDKMYNSFIYKIPYPILTIRKMKSRWGVCNVKTKRITLNLELIKKDLIYLDYVIIHELSHLIYPNHSRDFWKCVEDNMPNYKNIRKELKNDE